MKKNKKAFILFGPSGSGKTYIKNYLSKRGISPLKLHTTRKKRVNEKEDDYYYIDIKKFNQMESENQFLLVIKINESWKYGISYTEIEKNKAKNIVIDFINKEPALEFYKKILKTHKPYLCFFEIPLEKRMKIFKERGLNDAEIEKRLEREDNYNDLEVWLKNRIYLFNNFQTNIKKIENLLKA